jgi:hypothetical protein
VSSNTYFLRNTRPSQKADSLEKRFEAATWNTGNYFFEEALTQHISVDHVIYNFNDLPHDCGTLVLSMSNFISPSTDLGWFADKLEEKHVNRIVMVGAGAQAYDYRENVKLTDGTLRLARVLSERSTSIGVRGYFTAEVLANYGITNVEVVGCPTAFWSKRKPVESVASDPKKLAIHCTPTGKFRDKVGALIRHGMEHDANYVIQSEQWMMPFVSDDFADRREKLLSDYNVDYYAKDAYDPTSFPSFIKEKALIFFGMEDWIAAMSKFDFVYGSRFHGNMAAIQAGTPALNMTFDTRTRELCEYLNLPHIQLADFSLTMSPTRLRDMADFTVFTKTYSARMRVYKEFLERNGLATRNLVDQSNRLEMQKENANSSYVALLKKDLAAGLITQEEFDREVSQRLKEDRSETVREQVDRGTL